MFGVRCSMFPGQGRTSNIQHRTPNLELLPSPPSRSQTASRLISGPKTRNCTSRLKSIGTLTADCGSPVPRFIRRSNPASPPPIPSTYRLEVFTKGGCNPWGHAWDDYGNSFFTDGAGFQGISYCVPGAMYFTYAGARRELQSISPGNYPKFASLEVVRSPQFPDDWQGDFITCDFRAHRVVHFKYSEAGAGFQTKEMPDLLRSTNVTFRPIDVKFGPDSALYIADWSNPIIQHGEVDFRDPRRDKEHGRIWRVTAKGRVVAKKENLAKLKITELLDRTLSKNGWEQEQARRVLRLRDRDKVFSELNQWLSKQTYPRAR